MNFRVADIFTASFNRLADIDGSKDMNFWSARINRDVRLVERRSAAA